MASLPIGGKSENDGGVKGFPNIFIADSSILPSHVGRASTDNYGICSFFIFQYKTKLLIIFKTFF